MSYEYSVSPTVSVEVAAAKYTLSMNIMEVTHVKITGEIILDDTRHSIDKEGIFVDIEEGSHTIEVVVPSGYSFDRWWPYNGASVDNPNVNPTTLTMTGDGHITAFLQKVAVETALSIEGPPSPVVPSEQISFKGYLTRVDTGAGIGSQTVNLEQPPGTKIGSGTTDSTGAYSITVTAPSAEGVYKYRTRYPGTAGYTYTASRTLGIGVGTMGIIDRVQLWWRNLSNTQKLLALLIIGGGTGAVYMGTKK